jgi:hypothetical protein
MGAVSVARQQRDEIGPEADRRCSWAAGAGPVIALPELAALPHRRTVGRRIAMPASAEVPGTRTVRGGRPWGHVLASGNAAAAASAGASSPHGGGEERTPLRGSRARGTRTPPQAEAAHAGHEVVNAL